MTAAQIKTKWKYGWRFLNGAGGTNPHTPEREHYSVLPRPDQKWSDWTEHPNPASPDGSDCGAGRLHVMLKPDARYAPTGWHVWYARWRPEDELGRSEEKASVTRYQLRRVRPAVLDKTIQLGWWRGANLSSANLSSAILSYADLRYANLRGANLSSANLSSAILSYAILSSADLRYANLRDTNLSSAILSSANLSSAILSYADLRYANLSSANLSSANLSSANLSSAILSSADLRDTNLSGANLSYADLRGAMTNEYTIFPANLDRARLEPQ